MKIEEAALLASMDDIPSRQPATILPLAIDLQSVWKSHGKATARVQALRGVTLRVPAGATVALIGPNGAGKSSLVDILTGFTTADSGTVKVLGMDIVRNRRAHSERIGVQFQEARLFTRLTVGDYMKLFSSFYKKTVDTAELCHQLGLHDHIDKKVQELSGGYRQRLALALALINDPELVILDEPTTGLDPIVRRDFWQLIRSLRTSDKTVLFSTHYMEEAQALADHLIMLSRGNIIAEGTPDDIIALAGENCTSLDDAYTYFAQNAERETA